MNNSQLLVRFFEHAIAAISLLILSIVALVYFIKKFRIQNATSNEFEFLFFRNKQSLVDFIPVAVFVGVVAVCLFWSGEFIADIPNVINADYKSMIGVVVGQDSAGREDISENRAVQLQDVQTDEVVSVLVYYTPIRNNETYEVVYLPHSKIGTIIKKIEVGDY